MDPGNLADAMVAATARRAFEDLTAWLDRLRAEDPERAARVVKPLMREAAELAAVLCCFGEAVEPEAHQKAIDTVGWITAYARDVPTTSDRLDSFYGLAMGVLCNPGWIATIYADREPFETTRLLLERAALVANGLARLGIRFDAAADADCRQTVAEIREQLTTADASGESPAETRAARVARLRADHGIENRIG